MLSIFKDHREMDSHSPLLRDKKENIHHEVSTILEAPYISPIVLYTMSF